MEIQNVPKVFRSKSKVLRNNQIPTLLNSIHRALGNIVTLVQHFMSALDVLIGHANKVSLYHHLANKRMCLLCIYNFLFWNRKTKQLKFTHPYDS